MVDVEEHVSNFYNYPRVREAKVGSYPNDASPNPVLRGLPLAIALIILRSSSFVSGILWKGNRFDDLYKVKELDDYLPRWDPTVIPIQKDGSSALSPSQLHDLPAAEPRKSPTHHYTCADFHKAYLSGKVTPRDVIDTILPMIRRDTSPLGEHHLAFISVQVDLVRKAADASTKRYKEGKPLSMLDGLPIAMKDDGELEGHRRTMGSPLDMTNPQGGTEWSIKKMEEAGGIVIGKTVMPDFGVDACGANPYWGSTLNPHNRNFYCGGSSAGSAYAVATGLVPLAHAADACGSIRNPAAFTGIYGLKTSHGRISRIPTIDLVVTEGVTGPVASSLDDLALAYRIMATPDPSHSTNREFPSSLTPNPSPPSPTKFLGIPESWISLHSPSASITKLFSAAINYYTTASPSNPDPYTLIPVPIEIPLPILSQKAQGLCCLTHVADTFTSPRTFPLLTKISGHTELLLRLTLRHSTAPTLISAQKFRSLHMSHLASIYTRYPGIVIMYPTTPCIGWPVAHHADVTSTSKGANTSTYGFADPDRTLRTAAFSWLANFTGCPALTRPMGYAPPDQADRDMQLKGRVDLEQHGAAEREVPIGITGMAEWGEEERLIRWARDGEGLIGEESGGGIRRPDFRDGKVGNQDEGRWVDVLAKAAAAAAAAASSSNGDVVVDDNGLGGGDGNKDGSEIGTGTETGASDA